MPLWVKRPLANQVGDPSNKRLKTDILASPGTTWRLQIHSFPNILGHLLGTLRKNGCLGVMVGNTSLFFGTFFGPCNAEIFRKFPVAWRSVKNLNKATPWRIATRWLRSVVTVADQIERNMMLKFTCIHILTTCNPLETCIAINHWSSFDPNFAEWSTWIFVTITCSPRAFTTWYWKPTKICPLSWYCSKLSSFKLVYWLFVSSCDQLIVAALLLVVDFLSNVGFFPR